MAEYKLSYTATEIDEKIGKIDNLAKKSDIPNKTSQLENDSGFITDVETDTTLKTSGVPADAKATGDAIAEVEASIPNITVESENIGSDSFVTVTIVDSNGETHSFDPVGKEGADGGWYIPEYKDGEITWDFYTPSPHSLSPSPASIPIPTKTSELENDSGFITSYTETDPTVPDWAKAASKPTYTANEVGLGNVDNVKQYSASNPPPYPVSSVNGKTGEISLTASDVGARASTWMPTAANVGADASGTASSAVSTHNSDITAHADIRAEIEALTSEIADNQTIPDYWQEHIDGKIATIKANQDLGGKDAFSFVVITDSHYSSNLGKNSGILARKIMDACNIRFCLILGDAQTQGSPPAVGQVLAERDDILAMFRPVADRALWQQGNHDGSWGSTLNGTTYPYNLTPAELYNRIHAVTYASQNAMTDESGTGYYVDDPARKVRYIMLNTHCNPYEENEDGSVKYNNMCVFRFTQSQYDLVVEALSSVPGDSWSVVVATHVPINNAYAEAFGGDTTSGDHINMRRLLTAYKNKAAVNIEWAGTGEGGGGGGYTNLFDSSASGFSQENDTKFLTNWMPYSLDDNDGAGTIYHIKGLSHNAGYTNPYKMHFAEDENGKYGINETGGTSLMYCTSATPMPLTNAGYDSSVKLVQHKRIDEGSISFHYVQFEIREALPENLIITANENIVESASEEGSSAYDAVSVTADFTEAKGELIGYFSGHMHQDYHYAAGDGWGIDIITTTADAADVGGSTGNRVAGTTTEQSFDVFTVDRASGTIYVTKIGAGSDREISY